MLKKLSVNNYSNDYSRASKIEEYQDNDHYHASKLKNADGFFKLKVNSHIDEYEKANKQ